MSFRPYHDVVDFDGINVILPKGYRYLSRDAYGFIQAWRERPTYDNGVCKAWIGRNGELPITAGHQNDGRETMLRKYRRKGVSEVQWYHGTEE